MRRLIAVTIVSRRTRSRLCDLNFALTCNDWIIEWGAMSKQLGWWMRLVKLLIETGHQPIPQTEPAADNSISCCRWIQLEPLLFSISVAWNELYQWPVSSMNSKRKHQQGRWHVWIFGQWKTLVLTQGFVCFVTMLSHVWWKEVEEKATRGRQLDEI